MKRLILMAFVVLASSSAFARIHIVSTSIDKNSQQINITISYKGGCMEHQFTLTPPICQDSSNVNCRVQIIDSGASDKCDADLTYTIRAPLKSAGLEEILSKGGEFYIQYENYRGLQDTYLTTAPAPGWLPYTDVPSIEILE